MKTFKLFILISLVAVFVASCGNKGNLYHPKKDDVKKTLDQ